MFKKILKIILTIVLVISCLFTTLSVISCTNTVMCSAESVFAESASSVNTRAGATTIDLSYPELPFNVNSTQLNLVPFPYQGIFINSSGLTYTVNSDGSILVSGLTTSTNPNFYLFRYDYAVLDLVDGLTYTLSPSLILTVDSLTGFIQLTNTFVWSDSYSFQSLTLSLDSNITYNDTFYPMLVAGSSLPSAFIPPIDILYNGGYNEAISVSKYGIFNNVKVDLDLIYEDDSSIILSDLTPNLYYNSIDLQTIAREYETVNDSILNKASLTVNFAEPFSFSAFPIYLTNYSADVPVTLISVDGFRYSGEYSLFNTVVDNDSLSLLYFTFDEPESVPANLLVDSIYFPIIHRPSDNLYIWSLITRSSDYLTGYDNGYNDGNNNGYNKGFIDGLNSSSNSAYQDGYNDGYNDGIGVDSMSAGYFLQKCLDILDVKIFGFISLGDILKIVVGASLTIFALKLFAGG